MDNRREIKSFFIVDSFGSKVEILQRYEDDYIDVTYICTQLKRELPNYRRLASAIAYSNYLADMLRVDPNSLFKTVMDGRVRHVWADPRIAVEVIAWCTGPAIKVEQNTMWMNTHMKEPTLNMLDLRPQIQIPKKQKIFEQIIRCAFPLLEIVVDRPINHNCKYRPDILMKTEWGYIVFEIDEMQHMQYTGEIQRVLAIREALSSTIVFLRINPDQYTDAAGDSWNSIIVKCKVDDDEVMRRWKILYKIVERLLKFSRDEIVYVFYDGYSDNVFK
jgi:hypothetical protein